MDVEGRILQHVNEEFKNTEAHAPVWPKGMVNTTGPKRKWSHQYKDRKARSSTQDAKGQS